MEHLKMHSMNKIDENVSKIATLFPNCVTEAKNDNGEIVHKIDFDMLKQELSSTLVEGREERYQFTWPDKKQAILTANAPINKTLRPCREESVDFDNTENLYIEGDNLEVLKLLQETYLGKIKMIYIDPPYNTGNDTFVYNDSTILTDEQFAEMNHVFDDEGNIIYDIRQNKEDDGRFHTNWLNMIYPRLKLSRDLLTDDGIIFISIDEKEITSLTKVCDEIFGAYNHLETFHLQVRYDNKSLNEDSDFQPVMEYVLIYVKDRNLFKPNKPSEPYDLSKFCFTFEELTKGETVKIGNKTVTIFKAGEWTIKKHNEGKIGYLKETWASGSIVKQSGTAAEFLAKYLIDRKNIDGLGALYKIHNMGEDGLGYRYVTGPVKQDAIRGKFYTGVPLERLEELKTGKSLKYRPIVNFYDYSADFGNIRKEGEIAFNNGKKPVKMINHLLFTANLKKEDIVLDFFSGSGSTAHAVMKYEVDNCLNIKYILVQLPEDCKDNPEYKNFDFKTICDIGKERIRRAGQQILKQVQNDKDSLFADEKKKLDIGFRVLKCDSTNMEDVYYTPDHIDTKELFKDNIKKDRTGEDLLFQTMLDLGIMLSSKIETKKINGKTVFCVEGNYLMACFDDTVDEATITEIAKEKPYYFVMRDPANSKDGDSLITNFEQIFATYSPETIRKVL